LVEEFQEQFIPLTDHLRSTWSEGQPCLPSAGIMTRKLPQPFRSEGI